MSAVDKVDVLGKTYRVEETPGMIVEDDASGKCIPHRCHIRIDPEQDIQQYRDTLWHEVMHGIFSEAGLSHSFKDEEEEHIVRVLSTASLQALRANPKLRTFLFQKDPKTDG